MSGEPVGCTYDEALADRASDAHVLGPDHFFTWCYGRAESFPDGGWPRRGGENPSHASDVLVGIILWHRGAEGQACGGICHFVEQPGRGKWTVESLDPLTLSPSIECKAKHGCGNGTHGYIRNGRWEGC